MTTESFQIAPSFADGRGYRVTSSTGTKLSTTAASSEAVVTMVSLREVDRGGTYGRDPMRWTESVERVVVDGDMRWSSEDSVDPPPDLVGLAALVGARYVVDVDSMGVVTVSNLELPMPEVSPKARETMGPIRLDKVTAQLESSLYQALSALPRRTAALGSSWTTEAPTTIAGSSARLATEWTLERRDGDELVFRIAGRYQSSDLDRGTTTGTARYRIPDAYFTSFDTRTELVGAGSRGQVTSTTRVATELLPAGVAD